MLLGGTWPIIRMEDRRGSSAEASMVPRVLGTAAAWAASRGAAWGFQGGQVGASLGNRLP